jgi:Kdo2-lipid IVA lauroyltransferase/acyltransferase
MRLLFRFLAAWPLPLLHAVGWCLGWLAWLLAPAYRRRWFRHTALAGVCGRARWASVGEAGKQVAELPRLWFGRPVRMGWEGAAHVEAALAQGHGLLFLTPHLGCFEITAQAYAHRFGQGQGQMVKPMTVLFRPPRKVWAAEILRSARERPGLATAPTSLAGVRQLIQALKRGETVGLLPDQVPPEGLGVWAPFFGEPAYTMTLSVRFARTPGTQVMLIWGERLSWGRGFLVHVQPWQGLMPAPLADDMLAAATQINQAMEKMVLRKPAQYLWGYARYKVPRKAS